MKILIPVDGSAASLRAVEQVLASLVLWREVPQLWLLNVQWALANGNVKLFISQDTLDEYYREQGLAALAGARAKLDAAGLAYGYHVSVGTPAEAIVRYAQEQQIDQIVMAASSGNSLSSWLLGSVAAKVVEQSHVPVLLVK